jgi:formylglycine-generating enzyme required for sulfatase activity
MKTYKYLLVGLLAVSPAAIPAVADAKGNLERDLVLYFTFDKEEPGGIVTDRSGHGNDGQAVNVQFVKDGHQGGAARFGLSMSHITVANKDDLNPPFLTLAAWIKTSYSDNQWRRIFDKDYDKGFALSNGGNHAQWHHQGQLEWECGGCGVLSGQQRRIDDGQWHHVAATYDGTVHRLYLDGQRISNECARRGRVPANNYDLTIGENQSNRADTDTETSFNGMMDDVMMFNRALSAEEIRMLYDSQLGGGGVSAPQAQPTTASTAVGSPTQAPAMTAPLPSVQPGQQWTNSLGMKFVPVPGTAVQFSIWDTRVQDYQAFVTATGRDWKKPDFEQGPTHPVVLVTWDDAKAFCAWLTEKERRTGTLNSTQEYRLPADLEWSTAVGLEKEPGSTPLERSGKVEGVYPWGTQWPPPRDAGNFRGKRDNDNFGNTSPVGSFAANRFGLYDMGGNVRQWCEGFIGKGHGGHHVARGSSWGFGVKDTGGNGNMFLLSSFRGRLIDNRMDEVGFRCVLASGGASAPQEAQPSPASTAAVPPPAPAPSPSSSGIQPEATNQSLVKTLSQQAPNAIEWALAPLDQSVPGDIRQNLTSLREDLLDEAKAKPVAGPEAYAMGRQLCDTLMAVLDERELTLSRVGYRAAQANANTRVTSQALEARRNYMMSWPQYAREKDQAGEIFRQQTNNVTLTKELPKVEWSNRTAVLRRTLDSLYAKYREALRQGKK